MGVYMKDVAVDTLPEESNVLHAANVLVRRLGWEKYRVVVNPGPIPRTMG